MEGDTTHPILVTLARHDKLAVWHSPDLPCVVVARSTDDRFLRVKGNTRYCHHMPWVGLVQN